MTDRKQENDRYIIQSLTKEERGKHIIKAELIPLSLPTPNPPYLSTKHHKFPSIPETDSLYNDYDSIDEILSESDFDFDIEILKQSSLRDAAFFCDLFHPYLNQYTKRIKTISGKQWITTKDRLSNSYLQKSIRKGTEIGWYSSIRTPVIGLDIDDHSPTGGWTKTGKIPIPSKILLDSYNRIIQSFRYYPSMVVRSPRGFHIYYLLNQPMHNGNLKKLAAHRIGDFPVEYKPTPNITLRVPVRKWILDPITLKRLYPGTNDVIDWLRLPIYSIEDLFDSNYRSILKNLNFPKTKSVPSKKPKASYSSTHAANILSKIERELLPFRNESTNDQMLKYISTCKFCNLTLNQTLQKVQLAFTNSPNYTGSLQDNPDSIERRVLQFYGLNNKPPIPTAKTPQLGNGFEQLISSHPFAKQRTKGIRKYLTALIKWKALQDTIFESKSQLYFMDDMYPFYTINRQNGLYPLPSSIQKKWNKNYNSLLPWLIDIGILKESPFPYSTTFHICKYYEIHFPELL